MAISGKIQINVGLPNESANSDSLYTAFNKINNNFDTLFGNSAGQLVAGNGIKVVQNPNTTTVSANLIAGNNIVLSNVSGAIIIDAVGGGNGGGNITGVLAGAGLTGGGFSGNVTLGLASSNVTAATYTNPTITIDQFGRITTASNNIVAGTVTSVSLIPGNGINIAGGPITSNGNITVINAGVTRLLAGSGITLTGNTGEITVGTVGASGTVTNVAVNSNTLVVNGSPITSAGIININLPNNINLTGNVVAGNVYANSGIIGAALLTGALTTASQPNITSLGNLISLNVVGNIVANNIGNISSYNLDGNSANVFRGDGSWGADVTNYSNSNVANYLPTYVGELSAGNANLGNSANANYFVGNGYFLTGLNLSNVVTSNANYAAFAGNVTINSQPNITSLGNLTNLTVIGNTSTGNLLIQANIPTSTIINFNSTSNNWFRTTIYHPNTSTNYPNWETARYRGNITNPTTVVDNDRVSSRVFSVYNGTGNTDVAFEHVVVTDVNSNSNSVYSGGEWRMFTVNPNGSNLANFTDQSGLNSLRLLNSGQLSLFQGSPTISNSAAILITNFGRSTSDLINAGGIVQRKARGNNQTQLSLQPNDQIGRLSFIGHNGTSYYTNVTAQLAAIVDNSYIANSANIPVNIEITTCDNAGNQKITSFYGNGDVSVSGNIVSNISVRTVPTVFANLPNPATVGEGSRAYITDANTTTFYSQVSGGASNRVPVFSDGTNWLVG